LAVREQKQIGSEVIEHVQRQAELDLVVPFTTPELTRAALDAANGMGAGLKATVRLVKVQVVPYPLDLNQSPVYIDFLKSQLARFHSELPIAGEVRLARELEPGLLGTLGPDSIVVLASGKRLWRTRNERLAESLRRAGHIVVLVYAENKQEAKQCSISSTVC
jgi:hypothetical protein